MIRNNPTTQYPEHDDEEEWPLGMRHWALPFILFLMYIKIANYLSTSYDSVCMERGGLPIQRFNEWSPKLDDIKIDIQNITRELNDKETSRTLNAIYIPVDIATSLRKENQQLKEAIDCEFDDERLVQIAKESERIDIQAYILLGRLRKLQEPRREIWAKLSGQFRQDLSKITYNVCYASTQLENLAREAKTFNKPTLRQLQKVSVATYVLCRESRSDAQKLNEFVDQLGVQLSLVETTMNRANGLFRDIFATTPGVTTLWKYWMAKGAMTEEELDSYEAERMMIGRGVINMLDGGFVLPEPVSR
ncbi:uncharacterized protein FMAN_13380 [Fusarium mangiferae]|uniref:Uncharacterized protein n=1 Tax=Fusarium mangiferae TaxID=192010 RepID=A0A1L7TIU8_FUSMA|nr:uncharacterized protein FMAN_13380 [Fusarium mangiferae]CVK95217.1 uncharacterized protein FMAN_13380 [Fusarium mangiferae]